MRYDELRSKAIKIKEMYDKLNVQKKENKWSYKEYTEGLVGDVGDLMKMIMAKSNFRDHKGDNLDEDIEHELSDCLWSLIVIAHELDIDLEKTFDGQMDQLQKRIESKLS